MGASGLAVEGGRDRQEVFSDFVAELAKNLVIRPYISHERLPVGQLYILRCGLVVKMWRFLGRGKVRALDAERPWSAAVPVEELTPSCARLVKSVAAPASRSAEHSHPTPTATSELCSPCNHVRTVLFDHPFRRCGARI